MSASEETAFERGVRFAAAQARVVARRLGEDAQTLGHAGSFVSRVAAAALDGYADEMLQTFAAPAGACPPPAQREVAA